MDDNAKASAKLVEAFFFAEAVFSYLRPDLGEGDFGGFELCRPPTSIPPKWANDSMAWFIFDTFMAASPRHGRWHQETRAAYRGLHPPSRQRVVVKNARITPRCKSNCSV